MGFAHSPTQRRRSERVHIVMASTPPLRQREPRPSGRRSVNKETSDISNFPEQNGDCTKRVPERVDCPRFAIHARHSTSQSFDNLRQNCLFLSSPCRKTGTDPSPFLLRETLRQDKRGLVRLGQSRFCALLRMPACTYGGNSKTAPFLSGVPGTTDRTEQGRPFMPNMPWNSAGTDTFARISYGSYPPIRGESIVPPGLATRLGGSLSARVFGYTGYSVGQSQVPGNNPGAWRVILCLRCDGDGGGSPLGE